MTAAVVTGGAAFPDSLNFGRKLTRDEALVHPLLNDFWAVVDHILSHDQLCATTSTGLARSLASIDAISLGQREVRTARPISANAPEAREAELRDTPRRRRRF